MTVAQAGAERRSDLAVDARGLVKRYGQVLALDGLDLEVRRNETHGFLGPNGAGKSTTVRALLGQIRLGGGSARLFGLDCWRDAVKAHRLIAYVPGDVTLWPSLSGRECIDVLGAAQGSQDSRRRNELIERFDLDPTKKTRTYSKGNRQKVALIAALATRAELLLLDEPTSGLDPLMESVFQDCIREASHEGRTVLLSSHILGEVDALCDRVSIVRRGRVVQTGRLADLRAGTALTIDAVTATPFVDSAARVPGVKVVDAQSSATEHTTHLRVAYDALGDIVSLIDDARPSALTIAPPSLDELFLASYREEGDDDAQRSSGATVPTRSTRKG